MILGATYCFTAACGAVTVWAVLMVVTGVVLVQLWRV